MVDFAATVVKLHVLLVIFRMREIFISISVTKYKKRELQNWRSSFYRRML